MPIYAFRTSSFARDIILYGNRTFNDIPAAYVPYVKQYAADTFLIDQIDNALTQGWITQQEHDDILALKGPEDPQYAFNAVEQTE